MNTTSGTPVTPNTIVIKKISTKAFLTLLLIGFMMGANHVSARFAFNDGLDVMTAVFARSFITCLVLVFLILIQRVPSLIPIKHRKYLLTVGILLTIQSICIYAAVSRMPVALALLAFNTYPLMVAILARVFYKELIEPKVIWIMPIMLVGLCLALDVLGAASGLGVAAHWAVIGVGVGFAFTAAFSFSLALVLTQHGTAGLDGRVRSASNMGMVAIITFILCQLQGGPQLPQHTSGWLSLGLLILFYGTAFTIMFTVLPRLGAVGNTSIMNVEPVCALMLAWVILDQKVSLIQCIGALIVVIGAIVLGLRT